jgi:ATP-dependent DNA helicase DinG
VRERVVNRAVNPLLQCLPAKIETFRPEQVDSDCVVLDAPTGSGKTVIAETVRLLKRVAGLYICHSKGLQDQFSGDFAYARVVKGRANYPTGLFPKEYPRVSCDDCTWTAESPMCGWCDDKKVCPYERAKMAGLKADVAVLNSAYALTEWNGPGRFSGRGFVVVDEADTFANVVQSHISVQVGRRRMARYGWTPPSKVTVASCWLEWLDEHIPKAEKLSKDDREQRFVERLVAQMRTVRDGISRGLPYAFNGRDGSVEFKPVVVDEYCKEAVWKHGTKWLLASATVVSSSSMLRALGWTGSYQTVVMGSSFSPRIRPVVVKPVVSMARSGPDDRYDRMARAVHDEVAGEPGRVLVHTVSYDLAEHVCRSLRGSTRRPVFSYQLAGDRAAAISGFKRARGGILVACSADRGVDLPDDLCRLIVIAKVPYPNLGDRMVSMRFHMPDGKAWYAVETVRSVVQMAGRGVRHEGDYCRTVVLDSQFRDGLWLRGAGLFPRWFREAVIWDKSDKREGSPTSRWNAPNV